MTDAVSRGKGPGWVAWSLVVLSLVLPAVGGWLGVTSAGAEPSTAKLYASVGVLAFATLVGLVVHLWGIVRAFYPAYNGGWLAVAVFGLVSGVATLAAAGSVLVYVFKD
jgi:hypothetical protein